MLSGRHPRSYTTRHNPDDGNETVWDIHVWTASYDSIYRVTTRPATVYGFSAGVTYNASIRPLCGTELLEGDWSDTIQFSTAVCPNVTGLTTSNVTANSVTLNWTANSMAQSYAIEYGLHGFTQGAGSSANTTGTSYVVSGLLDETQYDFYIRAVCGTDWTSENWTMATATTDQAAGVYYTITTAVNNTAYGSVTGGGNYAENSTVTLTAVPNTGYHFTQWHDAITTNPRTITVTGNATYTAYFAANTYTVTVTSANPTMGTVSGSGTYNYGATATITATANNGYHFTQWSDGNTNASRSITVTSDTAFTAQFAANTYTVTVAANDASMGTVSGGGSYDYLDTAILTATPNSGYFFRQWSDGNTANPRSLIVTDNVSLTAVFSADSSAVQNYTVTLTVNDASMGTLSTYGGTYAEGTELTVTATANNGFHFVDWSDNNTSNPRTIVVNADITLMANFAQDIDSTATLTVSVNNTVMGYVNINGQEASIYNGRLGDVVQLEAVAHANYAFVNWSDGVTTATRSLTLTENNMSITANFEQTQGIGDVATASCLIYPNPTHSATTVSVSGVNGKVKIAIVDMNGRTVVSETLECSSDCEKTMDVDGLAQGAYFVRITSDDLNMVRKLIVR